MSDALETDASKRAGPDSLQARVEELETQLAFQEDLQRRLDEVVSRQDRELLELRRLVKTLAERIDAVGDGAANGGTSVDEVPPHY